MFRKKNDGSFNILLKNLALFKIGIDEDSKKVFNSNVQIIVPKLITLIPTISHFQNIQLLKLLAQKNIRDPNILEAVSKELIRFYFCNYFFSFILLLNILNY